MYLSQFGNMRFVDIISFMISIGSMLYQLIYDITLIVNLYQKAGVTFVEALSPSNSPLSFIIIGFLCDQIV